MNEHTEYVQKVLEQLDSLHRKTSAHFTSTLLTLADRIEGDNYLTNEGQRALFGAYQDITEELLAKKEPLPADAPPMLMLLDGLVHELYERCGNLVNLSVSNLGTDLMQIGTDTEDPEQHENYRQAVRMGQLVGHYVALTRSEAYGHVAPGEYQPGTSQDVNEMLRIIGAVYIIETEPGEDVELEARATLVALDSLVFAHRNVHFQLYGKSGRAHLSYDVDENNVVFTVRSAQQQQGPEQEYSPWVPIHNVLRSRASRAQEAISNIGGAILYNPESEYAPHFTMVVPK